MNASLLYPTTTTTLVSSSTRIPRKLGRHTFHNGTIVLSLLLRHDLDDRTRQRPRRFPERIPRPTMYSAESSMGTARASASSVSRRSLLTFHLHFSLQLYATSNPISCIPDHGCLSISMSNQAAT